MKCWLACAATALAACGRLGYDAAPQDPDGGPNINVTRPDASAEPDAARHPDAAPADAAPLGPFGEVELIPELAEPLANDDDPSLTGDLLEIYFKSDRGSPDQYDIWRATRGVVDAPWGPAERVDELSSGVYDASPEVSFDGLTIFIASSRAGGSSGSDIWQSTRASRDDAWSTPVLVVELSSDHDEWAAVTDESLTAVVITRGIPDHSLDLFGASRASVDQPWSQPEPLVGLATEVYEADAHLDASGTSMVFAGELAGGDGRDIYQADRPSADDPFAAPARLVEVSSPARDEDPWLSPDARVLVFSSDRTGDQELYWTRR